MWLELQAEIEAELSDLRIGRVRDGFHLAKHNLNNVDNRPPPPPPPTTYTTTDAQRIFELYSSGSSMAKTSAAVGVSEDIVRRVLLKLNVPIRPLGRKAKLCECGKVRGKTKGMCRGPSTHRSDE